MNCCALIMYNGVPEGAILIMRSSRTEELSASMRKSRLRYLRDGNGQDLELSLLIEIRSVYPCLFQKEVD